MGSNEDENKDYDERGSCGKLIDELKNTPSIEIDCIFFRRVYKLLKKLFELGAREGIDLMDISPEQIVCDLMRLEGLVTLEGYVFVFGRKNGFFYWQEYSK